MKYPIIILFFAILILPFNACFVPSDTKNETVKKETPIKNIEFESIDSVANVGSRAIFEFKYQGCEYLHISYHFNHLGIAHKRKL